MKETKDLLDERFEKLKDVELDRDDWKNISIRCPRDWYLFIEKKWFEERQKGSTMSLQDFILKRFLVGCGSTYNPNNKTEKFQSVRDRQKKDASQ